MEISCTVSLTACRRLEPGHPQEVWQRLRTQEERVHNHFHHLQLVIVSAEQEELALVVDLHDAPRWSDVLPAGQAVQIFTE